MNPYMQDPRSMMLLGLGTGMMEAGGPSLTPTSGGQQMSRAIGQAYNFYNQAMQGRMAEKELAFKEQQMNRTIQQQEAEDKAYARAAEIMQNTPGGPNAAMKALISDPLTSRLAVGSMGAWLAGQKPTDPFQQMFLDQMKEKESLNKRRVELQKAVDIADRRGDKEGRRLAEQRLNWFDTYNGDMSGFEPTKEKPGWLDSLFGGNGGGQAFDAGSIRKEEQARQESAKQQKANTMKQTDVIKHGMQIIQDFQNPEAVRQLSDQDAQYLADQIKGLQNASPRAVSEPLSAIYRAIALTHPNVK